MCVCVYIWQPVADAKRFSVFPSGGCLIISYIFICDLFKLPTFLFTKKKFLILFSVNTINLKSTLFARQLHYSIAHLVICSWKAIQLVRASNYVSYIILFNNRKHNKALLFNHFKIQYLNIVNVAGCFNKQYSTWLWLTNSGQNIVALVIIKCN